MHIWIAGMRKHTFRSCVKASGNITVYLFSCQVVGFQYIFDRITVKELLFKTVIADLHLWWTVKSCDLPAKSAVQYTVLQCDNGIVIFRKLSEQCFINTCDIARIDERRDYACFLGYQSCKFFTQLIKVTKCKYSRSCAILCDLITVQYILELSRNVQSENTQNLG